MAWWDQETPQVVRTSKNVIRWYPRAGRLQVSRPDWDSPNMGVSVGKTVSVDVGAFREDGAAEDIKAILQAVINAL